MSHEAGYVPLPPKLPIRDRRAVSLIGQRSRGIEASSDSMLTGTVFPSPRIPRGSVEVLVRLAIVVGPLPAEFNCRASGLVAVVTAICRETFVNDGSGPLHCADRRRWRDDCGRKQHSARSQDSLRDLRSTWKSWVEPESLSKSMPYHPPYLEDLFGVLAIQFGCM